MRKLVSLLLLTLLLWGGVSPLAAQNNVLTTIETLTVDLWPDFDQAAVLVLITGTLSAPGTVTVPIPADADFHVLARIDGTGTMRDDLGTPQINNGQLTFSTPDVRFRIEYYIPYTQSGRERTFAFNWQAPLAVTQFLVSVQQPAAATTLTIDPPAAGQVLGQDDGLTYHNLTVQTVPAGQLATVRVTYTMSADTLTSDSLPATSPLLPGNSAAPAATPVNTTGTTETAVATNLPTWVLFVAALGIILIVAVVVWQFSTPRSGTAAHLKSNRSRKPQPQNRPHRAAAKPTASAALGSAVKTKFCHECGEPLQPSDRFCRQCGTAVR